MSNFVEFKIDHNKDYSTVIERIKDKLDNLPTELKETLKKYYEENKIKETKSWFSSVISKRVIPYDEFYNVLDLGKGYKFFLTTSRNYDNKRKTLTELYNTIKIIPYGNVDKIILTPSCAMLFQEALNGQ